MGNEKRVKRQKSESRSKIIPTYPFINKSGEIWFIFSSLLLCYRVLYKNYPHEWRPVLLCIASRGVRWHFLGPSSVGSRWEPNLWIRGALQLQARGDRTTPNKRSPTTASNFFSALVTSCPSLPLILVLIVIAPSSLRHHAPSEVPSGNFFSQPKTSDFSQSIQLKATQLNLLEPRSRTSFFRPLKNFANLSAEVYLLPFPDILFSSVLPTGQ